jgi:1-acyl-sn-glycerol-3-phosphate acyltransferase
MAEKFINRVPFASPVASAHGAVHGPARARRAPAEDERLLMVFPEGARGTAKLYWERHSLVDFGTGFMRLAIKTRTPIVPVASWAAARPSPRWPTPLTLGQLLGAPYVPITPYLLPLPLPVKMELRYGEPMLFEGTGSEDDEVIGPRRAVKRASTPSWPRACAPEGGT